MLSKTPKIAQVVCTYPPYRGGMGKVAYEYTRRLRDRGYNVHVFTSRQDKDVGDDPDYVHRIPSLLSVGNAGVMPSLYQRMKGFDLVHLHYPFFGGAEPIIVRKALRHDQGLVLTYHMDAVADGFRGAIFEAHKQVLFPWIVGRCDRVLVSSKDYFESSALSQIQRIKDRVEIHPFGVDLERFSPGTDDELKRDLNIPLARPVVLFVGGLDRAHHFKGVSVLIDALAQTAVACQVVVVGDGDLKETYMAWAKTRGVAERMMFVGGVSEEQLPRYYKMADVHVFPSTKRAEAFGLVALEAAASGIPTIASALPGVRSVVLDGETGVLVKPEDVAALASALEFLLMRTDVRDQFGRSARSHAETRFAWEPLVSTLEQTYKSVLHQQSPREY